jgi:hypothetical protein
MGTNYKIEKSFYKISFPLINFKEKMSINKKIFEWSFRFI